MKAILVFMMVLLLSGSAHSQIIKANLQASGLTCSMCSKAVKEALEKVPFVEKVMVDIKNQQYNLSFREGSRVEFDALSQAVEDAGFSVASLKVSALLSESAKVDKDSHLRIGDQAVHFLNGAGRELSGAVTFSIVDKSFVSLKEHRKYAALSKAECVRTGRAASCCGQNADTRIYHALL